MMRKAHRIIYYIFISFLAGACTSHESPDPGTVNTSDSLYTATAAMDIYDYAPEEALAILDSAVAHGNLSENNASFLRARIYCHTVVGPRLDTAWQICEALMESDFVENPDHREEVLDLLMSITRIQHSHEQCLRWATEKADLCRQLGEETEALRTEAEIGVLMAILGEEEKGLDKINSVITALDGQKQLDEMDACIIALKRKISVLQDLGREQEVIPEALHILEILDEYHKHSDQYVNNSYRMSNEEEHVNRYCDFYSSQVYGYLAHAYAKEAKRLKSLRQSNSQAIRQSRRYLALFEQSSYGQSLAGRKVIAPTWALLGDYDKMLATYDEVEAEMGTDTINKDYATVLLGRADAAEASGDTRAALDYQKRYTVVNNLLNRQAHRSQIHEYAVRYQLQEARRSTERAEAAKRYWAIVAMFLGLLTALSTVYIVLARRTALSIRKKNRVLSKEISERIAFEEKYLTTVKQPEPDPEFDTTPTPQPGQLNTEEDEHLNTEEELNTEESTEEDEQLNTEHLPLNTEETTEECTEECTEEDEECSEECDRELFDQIRKVISDENLHLNPQFDRQHLIERLHINKERIGAAFSRGSEYHSLTDFINDARLFHSIKLMKEHPDMTIAEVAESSGFSSRQVFSRNFKDRFAMTPTEFREKEL